MAQNNINTSLSQEVIESALRYERQKESVFKVLKILFNSIIVVAACSVLIANLVFPVMRVNGTSMEPIMSDGDIITSIKSVKLITRGDIIAFYYNDKVLLKRVIALPGDTVNIDDEGNVYVNNKAIEEPYITQKSLGICDVEFPLTVEENTVFVLGDHRSVSVDSRSQDVGNIHYERIIGKIVFRVYPLTEFGFFDSEKE